MEAAVREAKRIILSLIHNVEYRTESIRMKGLLENYDAAPCRQITPEKVNTICFIITRMVRFHGGQTSILHLGTELSKLGYKIIYVTYKPQSVEEMELCASSNLHDYKGKVSSLSRYRAAIFAGKVKEPDIVVASSWDTVSFAKKFEKSYKMYFVQDYEPLFYRYGEEYLMCRSTYLQGLHMVSLGEWNREQILRECTPFLPAESGDSALGSALGSASDSGLKIDTVSFPFDRNGYTFIERNYEEYRNKKKITLAVYMKYYGKRLPNLLPHMLERTKKILEEKGIQLEILYFGEAKSFKAKGGKNLGQLTREELGRLYQKADFGMVASMSNISLVPYEMHASGLPVIEFSDGTYPYFFKNKSALLTSLGEQDIAGLLLDALNNPSELEKMQHAADESMKNLSWEKTAGEFARIFQKN